MNSVFYQEGFSVPPKSKMQIDSITQFIRAANPDLINKDGAIDVLALLEIKYGKYHIIPDHEMKGILGLTLPSGDILLRQSVYDGACDGNGRDRFTIAHEIAHAIMHKEHIGLARPVEKSTKIFCNAEWQANEFAGRLLLPDNYIELYKGSSVGDIAEMFGISYECAQIRINKYKK
ncbi:ImmA/IrrE family metallo-endopeptidase [Actinobacillus arthritidis]|uniref:ImmA/IrrE family metallo-endopeptidase n=1 Tax=Actinobacillus arthritidis TaxID=157339 RepID=UPI0024414C06|nr:ImmA/IrrE family metallo-endopeptidase [Actinobacillus arthritidis]WGE89608.1 ImmA/IrrE family metallo-endopeptidase [Actinobacillus arthritidis]